MARAGGGRSRRKATIPMSLAFTIVIYLTAGIAIVVWLSARGRMHGSTVRAAAVLFWPAYLPMFLEPSAPASDPTFEGLRQQIDRLPIDDVRKREYQRGVERLAGAVQLRVRELDRLAKAEHRLAHLVRPFGADGKPLLDAELARVRLARESIEGEIGHAKGGILKLVLRLELLD